jgi:hypothetical protein
MLAVALAETSASKQHQVCRVGAVTALLVCLLLGTVTTVSFTRLCYISAGDTLSRRRKSSLLET